MISQETAGRVWNCYREIAAAGKLLEDMEETAERYRDDVRAESVRDAFGRHGHLQLGIPSGSSSHRLLDVSPALAKIVIENHINERRAELLALKELCISEIGYGSHSTPKSDPVPGPPNPPRPKRQTEVG